MNNPIGLSTPTRRKKYRHFTNNDFTMSDDEEDDYYYDDDIADFSSSSILIPPPFTYSKGKITKEEEEEKNKITITSPTITTTPAAATTVIEEAVPPNAKIIKDKLHPSTYYFYPFSLNRNINSTRPKTGNDYEYDDNDDYTADDPSLWWDDKDIKYMKYEKKGKKKRINNATSINFVIDKNLIMLYNTRCIIHEINLNAFQALCAVFENYYSSIISNLDVAEKTFIDMIQTIYSNFTRVQPPRNYHYSSIFSYIAQITTQLLTRRCVIELSRLLAVRDYIINAENYINFHSKCLLDCYYQITRGFDFNLHKNALSQWRNQSQYSDYLQNCISKYAERSNDILIKIKNGS